MSATPTLPEVIELSVISSGNANASFQLRSDHSVFIGTSNNCGLSLSGAGVDDIHCYVRYEDGKLWVEDWMSKSGTLINGERITERTEVQLGDCIQVGSNQIALQSAAPSILAAAPRLTVAAAPTNDDDQLGPQLPSNRFGDEQAINSPDNHDIDRSVEYESTDQPTSWPEARRRANDFGISFFDADEDETSENVTIALLRAEIEHLQAALAQQDARLFDELSDDQETATAKSSTTDGTADPVLGRMQELIEEANRSDERAAMLEELLLTAEVANAAEVEERRQLEAWIDDIEQRLAQRDAEHQAEVEALQQRLTQAAQIHERLIQQLRQATANPSAPPFDPTYLEQLQHDYQQSQQELAESKRQCAKLQQRLSQLAEEPQQAVREDRDRLAEEQKQNTNLKLELASKLNTMAGLMENSKTSSASHSPLGESSLRRGEGSVWPSPAACASDPPAEREGECKEKSELAFELSLSDPERHPRTNADQRIKALRDHLLQIHEQEQQAASTMSLAGRLKRLWQRIDGSMEG